MAGEQAREPFDLEKGPLLRASLARLNENDHVIMVTMHHIVSDEWSMEVLVREVAALYEAFSQGKPSPLEDLPIQYADFALWQRDSLQADLLDRAARLLEASAERCAASAGVADRQAAARRTELPGASQSIELSEKLTGQLKEMIEAARG